MSNNWLNNIKHVTPGEPVQAGIVSRPDRTLADRTEYLKQRLDAAELGHAVFDTDATIAPNVLPGQPVFWNATTSRYEQALAAVETADNSQTLVTQASADCIGLCYKKKSATLGDIVLYGVVTLGDISNAVDGPVVAGRYYLSADEPGKLVKERPAIPVSVCYVQGPKDNCADAPSVVITPQVRDFLEEHVHYRFELVTRAAGFPLTVNGNVVISSADASAPGWLPASHASFNGTAPAGAIFGYNIAAHEALSKVWPPQPIGAAAMLWDKGQDHVGATEIPLGVDGLAICDANGIWWMSSCANDVPWTGGISASSSSSSAQNVVSECPRDEKMRVIVTYLRMVFGNDRSVVTSLRPAFGSPITVTSCANQPATTGDLQLGLNLQLLTASGEALGGQAFKEITTDYKFKRGWVMEGIRVGSGPLTVSGSRSRALTAAEKVSLGIPINNTVNIAQGLVTISYNDRLVEREISPQIIRLSDTVERLYQDIPYIGFPDEQDSLLRVRLNVPAANLAPTADTSLTMFIRAQLFGRRTAVLPTMSMTYRILPRPVTATALVTTDSALTFTVPATSLATDTAIEVNSATFPVLQGDTVLVTLSRAGSTDSYGAEVGLLRLTGIVYAP